MHFPAPERDGILADAAPGAKDQRRERNRKPAGAVEDTIGRPLGGRPEIGQTTQEDAGPAAAAGVTASARHDPLPRHRGTGIHGRRYGEVLLVKGGLMHLTATVYNTLGLNDCPQAEWERLDPEAIRRAHGARRAFLNGPRHFLMDEIASADMTDEVVRFGELAMRRAATVPIQRRGGLGQPYTERVVNRTTTYVWKQGRAVYELIGPDGSAYVMQSYALMVDAHLTEAGLPRLGERLHLPPGWSYRARTLGRDLVLQVMGAAHLVQDDFLNSYQRLP